MGGGQFNLPANSTGGASGKARRGSSRRSGDKSSAKFRQISAEESAHGNAEAYNKFDEMAQRRRLSSGSDGSHPNPTHLTHSRDGSSGDGSHDPSISMVDDPSALGTTTDGSESDGDDEGTLPKFGKTFPKGKPIPMEDRDCKEDPKVKYAPSNTKCWRESDSTKVPMRVGPDYKKMKRKGLSKSSLFHPIFCEIYKSPHKVHLVAEKFDWPAEMLDPSRFFFIMNMQVPNYAPANPVWGEQVDDGEVLPPPPPPSQFPAFLLCVCVCVCARALGDGLGEVGGGREEVKIELNMIGQK
jgi:hypothetical protein